MITGIVAAAAFGVSNDPGGGVIVTEDPYYVNTAMQIDATGKADGTGYVTDDSRLANAISYLGNAQITDEKFVFDGSGDYLRFAARALWAPGWHGFTIELWGVEFATTGSGMLVAHYLADSGNDSRSFYLTYSGSALQLQGNPTGTSGSQTVVVSHAWTPATDGTEYDIAATWDGSTARLYIDGIKVAEAAYTAGFNAPPNNTYLLIGASQLDSGYTNYFNGKIRAVRYTKKIDRSGGVATWSARHALPLPEAWDDTGFADPDWDKVVLLLRGSNSPNSITVIDDGPWDFRNYDIDGQVAYDSGNQPFSGVPSLAFDGSGDDITFGHDPLFTLSSEDYTIELMARHTDVSGGSNNDRSYIGKYDASTGNREWIFWFMPNASPDIIRFASPNAGPTVASASFTPTIGTWYHIATTRNANDRKIFIDGAQSGSTVSSANNLSPSNQPLYIGSLDGVSNYFEGNMAELRFTKGVNRYDSGFTAPSAAFPRQ